MLVFYVGESNHSRVLKGGALHGFRNHPQYGDARFIPRQRAGVTIIGTGPGSKAAVAGRVRDGRGASVSFLVVLLDNYMALVYLVAESSTRAIYFPEKHT